MLWGLGWRVWPVTLFPVPASGSLTPVADHGFSAGLVVHPITAAGHIRAVPTRVLCKLGPQCLGPFQALASPLPGETLTPPTCPAAHPRQSGPAGPPGSVPPSSYWKDGGRESPMPPIRSSGGGRSVWPSVA